MIKTFGATGFGPRLNGVTPLSLGKPAARFPANVATDADLMIAVDRQQTRLAAPLDSSATSMTVENAAIISAYNLLTIDGEIVKTTGPPAGNVVPIARGFDGTTPALHLASATVSGFIDAYHHNSLVAEVEAIEFALGPNLSKIPTSPFLVSTAFDFAPQTPGGSLIAGLNVITLSPVPPGVSGANSGHALYISNGTGTAEAVTIAGGTAIGGAASGTVIVTCAGPHSGAWTIQSATAGIQEAIQNLLATGGVVMVPAGEHSLYSTINIGNGTISAQSTRNNITLSGIGAGISASIGAKSGATVLQWFGPNGGNMIQVNGPIVGVLVENLMFDGAPSGGSTIAATALYSMHSYLFRYRHLFATGVSGYAFALYAYENPTGFGAGSGDGIVDGMFTANLQTTGSGLDVGNGSYASAPHLDVARVVYRNLSFLVGSSGTGLRLRFTDSSSFTQVFTLGGAIGLRVDAPSGTFQFPGGISMRDAYIFGTTPFSVGSAPALGDGLVFQPWANEVGSIPVYSWTRGYTNSGKFFGRGWNTNASLNSPFANVVLANGANNDVNIGDSENIWISGPSGAFSISGFTGGTNGRQLRVYNSSNQQMTIESFGGSAAGNQIVVPGGSVTLAARDSCATFVYFAQGNAWLLMSTF